MADSPQGPPPSGGVQAPQRPVDSRGALAVWLAVLAYWSVLAGVAPGADQVPASFDPTLLPLLLAGPSVLYGPVLVLVVATVWHREKPGGLRKTFATLGVRRDGLARSVAWALPYLAADIVCVAGLAALAAPVLGTGAIGTTSRPPKWYAALAVVEALVPVAIVEELLGRGYLLARLLPPGRVGARSAWPAVAASALMFTSLHIASYLLLYRLSPASAALNLGAAFLASVFAGLAYLKPRSRNLAGPVMMHFLLDALPFAIFLVS